MRGITKARWSSPPGAARWKMVTQTYLIFSSSPDESRLRLHVWIRDIGRSVHALPGSSEPTLVAMITVAAGSTIAAVKIKNLAVFDAGTAS